MFFTLSRPLPASWGKRLFQYLVGGALLVQSISGVFACDASCQKPVSLIFYGQVSQKEAGEASFVLSDSSGAQLQTSHRLALSYDSSDGGPDRGDNDTEEVTTARTTASGIQIYDPKALHPAEYYIEFNGDQDASGADVTVEVKEGCYEAIKTPVDTNKWKIRVQLKVKDSGSSGESTSDSGDTSLGFSLGDTSSGGAAGSFDVTLKNVNGVLVPQLDLSSVSPDLTQQVDGSSTAVLLSGKKSANQQAVVTTTSNSITLSLNGVDSSGTILTPDLKKTTILQSNPGQVGNIITVTHAGVGTSNQAVTYTIDSQGAFVRSVYTLVGGQLAGGPSETTLTTQFKLSGRPAQKVVTRRYASSTALPEESSVTSYLGAAVAHYSNRVLEIDSADGQQTTYAYTVGTYNPTTKVFSSSSAGTFIQIDSLVTSLAAGRVASRTTRTITVEDFDGHEVLNSFYVYFNAGWSRVYQISRTFIGDFKVGEIRDGRTVYEATYGPDNQVATETDETGIVSSYQYNVYNLPGAYTRTKSAMPADAVYPAQEKVLSVQQATATQSSNFKVTVRYDSTQNADYDKNRTEGSTSSYDADGNLLYETLNGYTTSYSTAKDTSGTVTKTITRPSGAVETEVDDPAGRLVQRTGDGIIAEYHVYTDEADGTHTETIHYGTADGSQYQRTVTDGLGRVIKTESPGFNHTTLTHQSFYNSKGQLVKESNTGKPDQLYSYDDFGQQVLRATDVNGNGLIEPGIDADVVSQSSTYVNESGAWYQATTTSVPALSDPTQLIVTVSKQRLNLPSNTLSQSISIDPLGHKTTTTTTVDRPNRLVTEKTTYSWITGTSVRITRNGLIQTSQTAYQTAPTRYFYDEFGHLASQVDPAAGTTISYTYDNAERVVSTTVTSPLQQIPLTTTVSYVSDGVPGAGNIDTRTDYGRVTSFAYNFGGQVTRVWGDTYPQQYVYDSAGHLLELHTYRSPPPDPTAPDWPAGDVTRWSYDASTGLLLSKQDAAGQAVTYQYSPTGQLTQRTWARGVATNYAYDGLGRPQSITYSDGTPSVSVSYNAAGLPSQYTDAAGTQTLTYDDFLRLTAETEAGGLMDGANVTRAYDLITGAPTQLSVNSGQQIIAASVSTYNKASGRLETIANGNDLASYVYTTNSAQIDSVQYQSNKANKVRVSHSLDGYGRLRAISTGIPSATPLASFNYTYDDHNQRQKVTLVDGGAWNFSYDAKGQVQQGLRVHSDGNQLGQNRFDYNFDDIGNRTSTAVNQQSALYTSNQLNQVLTQDVRGKVDVLGSAGDGVRVSVSGWGAARQGSYFSASIPADNSQGPAFPLVKVVAAQSQNGKDVVSRLPSGHAFLPQSPQAFTYDADGNVLSDGRWNYSWDAENRLTKMETRPEVAAALPSLPVLRLEFAYDYSGRRISKKVSRQQGSDWVVTTQRRFYYDQWNLVAETDALNADTVVASYVWGLDLSGSPQGAGGVGGLLWAKVQGVSYVPNYNGNGDIMGWSDLSTGTLTGLSEYGPFGEVLQRAGMSTVIPFGFSTKYNDNETGLLYYGFRYYNPNTGRWISRDQIEENGGANLYGFAGNDPIGRIDGLGNYSIGAGYGVLPLPHYQSPPGPTPGAGFNVVGTTINDWFGKVLQVIGIDHVDIAYNGSVVYIGKGGGIGRMGANYPKTNHVYSLTKKMTGTMRAGPKKYCLKCQEASDADILEALQSRHASSGKNCQGDVQDAVDEVCLAGFKTIVGSFFPND